MSKNFSIAVTGDSIIRVSLSDCDDDRFLSFIKVIQDADVAFTQLELPVHDYEGPELFPAAEAGHNWARAPLHVVEDLKWAGFDIVSTASNHSLDYSYGGLRSTWAALKSANLPFAGTGNNLAEARQPAYVHTPNGTVALVSMCSSFVRWSRAGAARHDMQGRPGVNPLRFYYNVDSGTIDSIRQLGIKLGWCVEHYEDTWILSQPGTQNTIYKFVEQDRLGVSTVADEDDAEGNLASIRLARTQADYVIAHLHSHDFHPEKGLSTPPDFVQCFARSAIDAGADIFVAQGAHAPIRGIELYKGMPIFYDPGEVIASHSSQTPRLPSDFYFREGYSRVDPTIRRSDATPAEAFAAMHAYDAASFVNPPGGVRNAPIKKACFAAVCSFAEQRTLTGIKLFPATYLESPDSQRGIPISPAPGLAKRIIDYVAELSLPFGTKVSYNDGTGSVELNSATVMRHLEGYGL
jgi:poly-gamma-glutamate synthesis protein (capsule biosynthesis protein)